MSYTNETENSTFSGSVTQSSTWAIYVIPVGYTDSIKVTVSGTNDEDLEFTDNYITSAYLSSPGPSGVNAAYFENDLGIPGTLSSHVAATLSASNGGNGGNPPGFQAPNGQYVTSGTGYLVIAVYGYQDSLTQNFTISLSTGGSPPPPPPGPPPPPSTQVIWLSGTAATPTTISSGSAVTYNYTVENVGTQTLAAGTGQIYLGTSSTFSTSDTLLKTFNVGALAPNTPTSGSVTGLTINGASGTEYLFIDYNGVINETGITIGSPPPPPPPSTNVVITSASLSSSSIVQGSAENLNVTVMNNGSTPAATSSVYVYVTTASSITGLQPTFTMTVGSIAANTSYPLSVPETFNEAPGTYNVFFVESDTPSGVSGPFQLTIKAAAPVTYPHTITEAYGSFTSLTLNPLTQGGTADYSPSGYSLTISNIPSTSQNGVGLTLQSGGTAVTYAKSPSSDVSSDSFSYTVSDGHGGTSTNSFTIDYTYATVSSSSAQGLNGEQGESNAITFNVTLSQALDVPVTVQYATQDDTAKAGVNYNATSGSLTFQPGVTSLPVNVTTIGTNNTVGTTDFDLVLSNPTNAILPNETLPGQTVTQPYTGTIIDINSPGTIPSQLPADAAFQEDASNQVSGQNYSATSGPLTYNSTTDGWTDADQAILDDSTSLMLKSLESEGNRVTYDFLKQLANKAGLGSALEYVKGLWGSVNTAASKYSDLAAIYKNYYATVLNSLLSVGLDNNSIDPATQDKAILTLSDQLQQWAQKYSSPVDNAVIQPALDGVSVSMLSSKSGTSQTNPQTILANSSSADAVSGATANAVAGTTTVQFNIDYNTLTSPAPVITPLNMSLVFMAGDDNQIVHGGNAGNIFYASAGNDSFYAGTGNDQFFAGSGVDMFYVGSGHDTLTGGTGTSTAVYTGTRSQYAVVQTAAGTVQITDNRSGTPNGVSTDTNVTSFQFSDRTLNLAQLLDLTPPSQVHDGPVPVGLAHTVTILPSQLQFTDNLSTDAQEIYTVTAAPTHGTLLKGGVATSSFTQADIDAGQISYQENGSVVASDSFTFTVTDASGNTTTAQQLAIQVLPPGEILLRNGTNAALQLYVINNNQFTGSYSLGTIPLQWSVAGLGDFSGNANGNPNEADMLIRNTATGAFYIYDIVNNQLAGTFALNTGLPVQWQVEGFGDFSSRPNEADMLMRGPTGLFELYDISSNQIIGAYTVNTGLPTQWQVAGFGDFSSRPNETDMLMRGPTGLFELYDISNNQIIGAYTVDTGLPTQWQVAGFGDFSGRPNETDMLMRGPTGLFELYDISNNQIIGAYTVDTGLPTQWQVAGFGDFSGRPNETDMLMRGPTGIFELYDISNNQIIGAYNLGQIGAPWNVAGIPVNSPAGSTAAWMAPSLLADGPLTVGSGKTAPIPAAQLDFVDNFSTDAQETYTIVAAPTQGALLKNGAATTSFTQGDIDNGLISYQQSNLSATSDAFTFTVTDAAGNQTPVQQFQIQIVDRTAPSLVHDGLASVAPGKTVTVQQSQLQFDDNISTHAQETYTVTNAPTQGTLLKSGVAATSFTQADIDNGLISYVEGGSITATSDAFTFTVTDAAGNATAAQQFSLKILDVTPPSLVHDGSLALGVGLSAVIAKSQLQFDDNVSAHVQEIYTVTAAPTHGTLLKNGAATSSFTQADIDNGLISYQENGSIVAADSFAFTVTDAAGNTTAAQQFAIQVMPPAVLVMRGPTGLFELYDISNNQNAGAFTMDLGLPTQWQVQGFGNFSSRPNETDMLMRGPTGLFELYDISNNQNAGAYTVDTGLPTQWQVAGFGDFSSSPNESDMLMRGPTGLFELYDISNNQITGAYTVDTGLPTQWQVAGFGDFSSRPNETDMLMRGPTGLFELYDISNNQIIGAYTVDTGLPTQWQVAGFGDFSGRPNETDMLMRGPTGLFELYDISNNQIVGAYTLDTGLPTQWQVAGFGDFSGRPNEIDMLMRGPTGLFELYDISNNQIIGAYTVDTGLPTQWQVGGIIPNTFNTSGAISQLAQAMASFPSGGSLSSNSVASTPSDQLTQMLAPNH